MSELSFRNTLETSSNKCENSKSTELKSSNSHYKNDFSKLSECITSFFTQPKQNSEKIDASSFTIIRKIMSLINRFSGGEQHSTQCIELSTKENIVLSTHPSNYRFPAEALEESLGFATTEAKSSTDSYLAKLAKKASFNISEINGIKNGIKNDEIIDVSACLSKLLKSVDTISNREINATKTLIFSLLKDYGIAFHIHQAQNSDIDIPCTEGGVYKRGLVENMSACIHLKDNDNISITLSFTQLLKQTNKDEPILDAKIFEQELEIVIEINPLVLITEEHRLNIQVISTNVINTKLC